MSRKDLFFMSLKNLWRRKLRTFLTITGVIIGATSIVLMISLGLGMEQKMIAERSSFEDLRIINVFPKYNNKGMEPFTDKDIEQLKQVKNVDVIIPEISTYVKIIMGREATFVQLYGLSVENLNKLGYKVKEGKLFKDSDKNIVVVGKNIKTSFNRMGAQNGYGDVPMGKMVMMDIYGGGRGGVYTPPKPKNLFKANLKLSYEEQYGELNPSLPTGIQMPTPYNIKVVGELDGEGVQSGMVVAPRKYVEDLIVARQKYEAKKNNQQYKPKRESEYQSLRVMANDMDNVKDIAEQIRKMGYEAYGNAEDIGREKQRAQGIQLFLGFLGGISLIIAAIGITNTMIMSINERKREIGIMKVLGAEIKDIKRLFLSEAGLIGFIGGTLGLGLSYLGSFLVNSNQQLLSTIINGGGGYVPPPEMVDPAAQVGISYIPLYLAIGAIVFSLLIGVVAGYFPARRAMKMSVLQAIRDE